jgi:hypothetical protein
MGLRQKAGQASGVGHFEIEVGVGEKGITERT